jgi:hypothetical protein
MSSPYALRTLDPPQLPNDWLQDRAQGTEIAMLRSGFRKFDGVELNLNAELINLPVIYGYRRTVAPRVFAAVKYTDSTLLYAAYVISEGPIHRPHKIYVDDNQLTIPATISPYTIYQHGDLPYQTGTLWWEYSTGATNQAPNLLSEITGRASDFQPFIDSMSGLAYIVFKFRLATSGYTPYDNIPKITVDAFGRNIRPSNDFSASQTELGGSNPADVILDYMTNSTYGCSIPTASIDQQSFTDLRYSFTRPFTYYNNGPTGPRMTCNYVVDSSLSVQDNLRELCRQFDIVLTFSNGKFRVVPEYAVSDGTAYTTPYSSIVTVSDTAIIGDVLEVKPDFTVRYNKVTVRHQDFFLDFQTGGQTYTDSAGVTSDGRTNVLNTEYSAITNPYIARNTAETLARKSRGQSTYKFTLVKNALRFTVGDVIQFNSEFLNLHNSGSAIGVGTNQLMRIISMTMNPDMTFSIEAVTHSDSYYPPYLTNVSKIRYTDTLAPYTGGVDYKKIVADANLIPVSSGTTDQRSIVPSIPAPTGTLWSTTATNYSLVGPYGTQFWLGPWRYNPLTSTSEIIPDSNFSLGAGWSQNNAQSHYGGRTYLDFFSNPQGSVLIYRYQFFMTYRYQATWNNVSANKFYGANRIYYTYEVKGQQGWMSSEGLRTNKKYQVVFDPEQPATKPVLVNSLGQRTTFELNQLLEPNADNFNYGCPYLDYNAAYRVYTPGSVVNNLGGTLNIPIGNPVGVDGVNYYNKWVIPPENYAGSSDPTGTVTLKFFVPVNTAEVCRYIGSATINLNRARIADNNNSSLSYSRGNWNRYYGTTRPYDF